MNGFPQDDALSLQYGCCGDFPCNCTANLDIFYPHQFVQNEEIANVKSGEVCAYKFEHTPILNNSIIGTIYYDGVALYTFNDKNGEIVLKEIKEKDKYPDRAFPTVECGFVNYNTNVMSLTWSRKINAGKSLLITCYEYNLECQMPEPLECPQCHHKFYDQSKHDAISLRSLQELANGNGNLDLY